MRCIPRQLLIHSAEVYTPESEDCFGKVVCSGPVKLCYVRIDPVSEEQNAGFNVKNVGQSVLIYDCRSSLPTGFDFAQGQKIVYNGKSFGAVEIRKLYDKNTLHHIEVTMEEI